MINALERIYYELKPYLCFGLGLFVFFAQEETPVPLVFALLLIGVAIWILRMRLRHRRGTPFEQFLYDSTPYFYLGLGAYSIVALERTPVIVASSVTLFLASAVVFYLRSRGLRAKAKLEAERVSN